MLRVCSSWPLFKRPRLIRISPASISGDSLFRPAGGGREGGKFEAGGPLASGLTAGGLTPNRRQESFNRAIGPRFSVCEFCQITRVRAWFRGEQVRDPAVLLVQVARCREPEPGQRHPRPR